MTFDKNEAGKFRANPHANVKNNCHHLDPDTPGTPLEDTATVDTTGDTEFQGITYTGKDGVTNYVPFQKTTSPDGGFSQYTVPVASGRYALVEALKWAITQHEVNPIIKVEGSGANYDILHIGSGTVNSIRIDGTDEALSRGAITAFQIVNEKKVAVKPNDDQVAALAIAKEAEKKYKKTLKSGQVTTQA